eukprot:2972694-Pyramimonas_sp.AAC.1
MRRAMCPQARSSVSRGSAMPGTARPTWATGLRSFFAKTWILGRSLRMTLPWAIAIQKMIRSG